ncbi:uncharacterized protein Z518_03430 [Rhinocladiella mackenziei CBS 650.93]|uniref:Ankyrin n=1 Tax=Rhinocladiella mackenziei CBS 650.93 TaxID=1442369 RepID=A0A0D2HDY1_9EURO|nr:uncharacterized protein Z518_03430 [Rhinocladiella mackenziei CBS 650.93]KIX08773.1 hypothetical protein Z518_03430 [Rhinocladiella mackenziei CBS 650.93]
MTNLPWFRLQSVLEQPEYMFLQASPALDGVPSIPSSSSNCLPTEARRGILSNLLGSKLEVQLLENVPQVTSKLQRLVPERYEGELSEKVGQLLNPRSTSHSSLWFLFGLAAYFVSNNTLGDIRTDAFLTWVIDQKYTDSLERLLQINTPTTQAATEEQIGSNCSITLLEGTTSSWLKRLSRTEYPWTAASDFYSTLAPTSIPLCMQNEANTALGIAVARKNTEIVALLLEHDASTSYEVAGIDLLEWPSLNWRNIYSLLKEKIGSVAVGATIGDLVDATNQSSHSLHAHTIATRSQPRLPHLGQKTSWTALNLKRPRQVCDVLIGFKAEVNVPGILRRVILKGDFQLLQTFVNSGVNLEEQGMEALVESAGLGNTTSAAFLLHSGVDINTPGLEMNPLQTAAEEGCLEMVEFLLSYGADINAPAYMRNGRTALQSPTTCAAQYGRLKMVRMLLDHGADINEAPAYRFGRTALQAAVSTEDMELVQFLLEKGADVNAKPAIHGGITALQGATVSGNIMLAKLLLDKGAHVNAAPSFSEGRYAIEGAAEHGRLDMGLFLLNAGAVGNVFRGTGFKYAIKLAEENGHFAIANLLKNDCTPPQQSREQELAYVGSWAERSDLNQQSGSGCMNSDSSGRTSDRSMSKPALTKSSAILTVQQATRVRHVPKKPIKMGSMTKDDERGQEHAPLERHITQVVSEDVGSREKDLEMPILPTLEPRRLRECKQTISMFEQTLGPFASSWATSHSLGWLLDNRWI